MKPSRLANQPLVTKAIDCYGVPRIPTPLNHTTKVHHGARTASGRILTPARLTLDRIHGTEPEPCHAHRDGRNWLDAEWDMKCDAISLASPLLSTLTPTVVLYPIIPGFLVRTISRHCLPSMR